MKKYTVILGLTLFLAAVLSCTAAAAGPGGPSDAADQAPFSAESGMALPGDTGTIGRDTGTIGGDTGDVRGGTADDPRGTLGDARDGDGMVDEPAGEGTDTAMTSSGEAERGGWNVFGIILAVVIAASVLVLVIALLPRKRGDM